MIDMNELTRPRGRYKNNPPLVDLLEVGDCWKWTGGLATSGHGQVRINGRLRMVHRVFYEVLVGSIPEGLTLDHLCRNRACVNPDHLEPVTNRENVLRGSGPSAFAARQTKCKNGHEFDGHDGRQRTCSQCRRAVWHRHKDRYNAKRRQTQT